MLNPQEYVVEYRSSIRFLNTSLLKLIPYCVQYLEPIHKMKLEALKLQYERHEYFNASDFKAIASIFRRYKAHLIKILTDLQREEFVNALQELDAFDARAIELGTSMQQAYRKGNLQIVRRPADGTRFQRDSLRSISEY
jgi:hypothetical protein